MDIIGENTIPKDVCEISKEVIIEYCATKLAKFKVPEYVEFVSEFPRTSVGKIQKNELRNAIRS
jgi:crotonobetaine/carnitine-CoA ligase